MRKVAYLTDVEGRWEKLVAFCDGNPLVELTDDHRLMVREDALFVFGGDAIDRGPHGRRIVRTFLDAKRRTPDRVVLLAGNRDINKLRLARELTGFPPSKAPPEIADGDTATLLRFIFSRTMGAREAFDHRATELANEGVIAHAQINEKAGDDAVVGSYLDDLAPDGALTSYLANLQLAHREEETLFVHGAVTRESLGVVPRRSTPVSNVDDWIEALNAFYRESLEGFVARKLSADQSPTWAELIRYQAPLPGTRLNQASVVYGRPTNDRGDPFLPAESTVTTLLRAGIHRVIVGHTPSGDCPTLLRDRRGFELLLADNSYGRLETGSRVAIENGVLKVRAVTELDSGERETVAYESSPEVDPAHRESPLGLRDRESCRLWKAELERGDYLGFRALGDYRVEQIAMRREEIPIANLVAPH